MENKELTFGQKAVGLTFNPGNNPEVDKVKTSFAEIIDQLDDKREILKSENDSSNGEKIRLLSVAITEAQGAQMWAVKAITWQDKVADVKVDEAPVETATPSEPTEPETPAEEVKADELAEVAAEPEAEATSELN